MGFRTHLLQQTAFVNLTWGNFVMIAVAFLFLFLAEKGDVIYERMCDVMQMVVREKQPEFLMRDCICAYTADLDIRKHGTNFSIAIEASYQGQR